MDNIIAGFRRSIAFQLLIVTSRILKKFKELSTVMLDFLAINSRNRKELGFVCD